MGCEPGFRTDSFESKRKIRIFPLQKLVSCHAVLFVLDKWTTKLVTILRFK